MLFQFAGNLDMISSLDPREGLLLGDFVPLPQLMAFQTANFFFLLNSNLTPLKHEATRVCMKSFYTCPLMGKKREWSHGLGVCSSHRSRRGICQVIEAVCPTSRLGTLMSKSILQASHSINSQAV